MGASCGRRQTVATSSDASPSDRLMRPRLRPNAYPAPCCRYPMYEYNVIFSPNESTMAGRSSDWPSNPVAIPRGGVMSERACEGKVALVTGASKGGTGTAIAIRLAAEGAKVMITARTLGGLEETQRRIKDIGGEARWCPVIFPILRVVERN